MVGNKILQYVQIVCKYPIKYTLYSQGILSCFAIKKDMKLLHAENGGVVLYVNAWKRVCSTCRPMIAKPGIMHWGGEIW